MPWSRFRFPRTTEVLRAVTTYLLGEPIVPKDGPLANRLVLGDGTTAGGRALAFLDEVPAGHTNRIVNSNFSVNQRGYVSGAALAAGAFGHDRWKAGTGGCTYTFVQQLPDTTITITAGTLIHTIPAEEVEGATYTLAWVGSAQARVGVNGAAPAVAYAASPITLANTPARQNVTIEFGTGTVGLVRMAAVSRTPDYIRRNFGQELEACMRDYQKTFPYAVAPADGTGNFTGSIPAYPIVANALPIVRWQFPVVMRSAPTLAFFNPASGGTAGHFSAGGRAAAATGNPGTSTESAHFGTTGGAPTIAAGAYTAIHATASTGF